MEGSVAVEARKAAHSRWVEWLGRIGLAAKGVSYALVAVLAIKVALAGEGRTEDRSGALRTVADEPFGKFLLIALAAGFAAYAGWRFVQATAGVLEAPAGRWLVIGIGAAVICVGVYNGHRAVTRTFERKLRMDEVGPGLRRFVVGVGVLGHLARMVVFSIIGWFLIQAALDFEPKKAVGLDGALAELVQHAYGRWMLFTVAAGILAYGVYAVVESRYRRI